MCLESSQSNQMDIEVIYGFVETNNSTHISEEELLVDHGVNLYSLELTPTHGIKACYGICPVLAPGIDKGPGLSLDMDVKSLLRVEDIESIEKLYSIYKKFHGIDPSVNALGLHLVYSSYLPFGSSPYSLRPNGLTQDLDSDSDSNQDTNKYADPLENLYKQAQLHIEEQVENQKRVIEYLEKLQQESRYKFKLTHNLPGKDFLSEGKITIKYDLEIYDSNTLIHHVKIVSSGLYAISDGYVEYEKQHVVISNSEFEPDDDLIGEFESWIYLYSDESMFKDLTQPLQDYLDSLC